MENIANKILKAGKVAAQGVAGMTLALVVASNITGAMIGSTYLDDDGYRIPSLNKYSTRTRAEQNLSDAQLSESTYNKLPIQHKPFQFVEHLYAKARINRELEKK